MKDDNIFRRHWAVFSTLPIGYRLGLVAVSVVMMGMALFLIAGDIPSRGFPGVSLLIFFVGFGLLCGWRPSRLWALVWIVSGFCLFTYILEVDIAERLRYAGDSGVLQSTTGFICMALLDIYFLVAWALLTRDTMKTFFGTAPINRWRYAVVFRFLNPILAVLLILKTLHTVFMLVGPHKGGG